ncbi:unnamed protein product, partial [Coregonus sp. 'balchen']
MRIQAKEKELLDLRQAEITQAGEDNERIFTELIRSIERRCCEMRELTRVQEETAVSQTEEHIETGAGERKKDTELEQLSHTEDHIYVLQKCQSISILTELTETPRITVVPLGDFGKKRLEDLFKGEWPKKSRAAGTVKPLQCPEPQIRPEFLLY